MPTIFVANSAVSKPMSLASRLWTLMTAPFGIWLSRWKLWRLESARRSDPAINPYEPWF